MKQKAKIGYPPEWPIEVLVAEFQVIFDRPPTPAEVERFYSEREKQLCQKKD
jgi:hypothetical protein